MLSLNLRRCDLKRCDYTKIKIKAKIYVDFIKISIDLRLYKCI